MKMSAPKKLTVILVTMAPGTLMPSVGVVEDFETMHWAEAYILQQNGSPCYITHWEFSQ